MTEDIGDRECKICDGPFNLDTEGGREGHIGMLYVAFCPTCLAGLYDMIEQFPTATEPGENEP